MITLEEAIRYCVKLKWFTIESPVEELIRETAAAEKKYGTGAAWSAMIEEGHEAALAVAMTANLDILSHAIRISAHVLLMSVNQKFGVFARLLEIGLANRKDPHWQEEFRDEWLWTFLDDLTAYTKSADRALAVGVGVEEFGQFCTMTQKMWFRIRELSPRADKKFSDLMAPHLNWGGVSHDMERRILRDVRVNTPLKGSA